MLGFQDQFETNLHTEIFLTSLRFMIIRYWSSRSQFLQAIIKNASVYSHRGSDFLYSFKSSWRLKKFVIYLVIFVFADISSQNILTFTWHTSSLFARQMRTDRSLLESTVYPRHCCVSSVLHSLRNPPTHSAFPARHDCCFHLLPVESTQHGLFSRHVPLVLSEVSDCCVWTGWRGGGGC